MDINVKKPIIMDIINVIDTDNNIELVAKDNKVYLVFTENLTDVTSDYGIFDVVSRYNTKNLQLPDFLLFSHLDHIAHDEMANYYNMSDEDIAYITENPASTWHLRAAELGYDKFYKDFQVLGDWLAGKLQMGELENVISIEEASPCIQDSINKYEAKELETEPELDQEYWRQILEPEFALPEEFLNEDYPPYYIKTASISLPNGEEFYIKMYADKHQPNNDNITKDFSIHYEGEEIALFTGFDKLCDFCTHYEENIALHYQAQEELNSFYTNEISHFSKAELRLANDIGYGFSCFVAKMCGTFCPSDEQLKEILEEHPKEVCMIVSEALKKQADRTLEGEVYYEDIVGVAVAVKELEIRCKAEGAYNGLANYVLKCDSLCSKLSEYSDYYKDVHGYRPHNLFSIREPSVKKQMGYLSSIEEHNKNNELIAKYHELGINIPKIAESGLNGTAIPELGLPVSLNSNDLYNDGVISIKFATDYDIIIENKTDKSVEITSKTLEKALSSEKSITVLTVEPNESLRYTGKIAKAFIGACKENDINVSNLDASSEKDIKHIKDIKPTLE